jgi:hypothetical protein
LLVLLEGEEEEGGLRIEISEGVRAHEEQFVERAGVESVLITGLVWRRVVPAYALG